MAVKWDTNSATGGISLLNLPVSSAPRETVGVRGAKEGPAILR